MTATRRLSAILAVDVVGYSRLMGEDEAGTARAVSEHRERHVRYTVDSALSTVSYPPIRDVRGNRRHVFSDRQVTTQSGRSATGFGAALPGPNRSLSTCRYSGAPLW